MAVVVASYPTLTAAEVIEFCTGKLAPFKAVKAVEFVTELPRNASGKILKGRSLNVHSPQAIGAFVEGDLVGIDIPRPQRDAGRIGGDPQSMGVPHRGACSFP